jgi:CrcB protein
MLYWLVGLGGVIGALLRYAVSEMSIFLPINDIAISVFVSNMIGSFLLAWLFARVVAGGRTSERIRVALGTGVLGSFTTFSALSLDTFAMLDRGQWLEAFMYVTLNIFMSLLAAWLGWRLGQFNRIAVEDGEQNL